MAESFLKDWNASKSQNNNGAVPFYRPIDLTPEEKEQACKNIGVASNDAIERLEDEFTDLRGDMATVSSDVASAVIDANSAVSAANSAVSAAQSALASVSGYATDLAAVSAKADTNSANISALSGQVATNAANISNVSAKNTTQDTQISALSGTVNGLTNNFNTVSAKVDTNASAISALSAAEANDRTDINTLSGNLNTVSGIASSARQEALEAKNTANATSAFCQNNYQNLTSGWSAMQNDWSAFSAAEDAVITAATAAIPGQVSAEVSGQLSGKQDKLTQANNAGINISISTAGVIDVKNNSCSAAGNYAIALGYRTQATGQYSHAEGGNTRAIGTESHAEGYYTSAVGNFSHGEGGNGIASGNYSHAEGYSGTAIGAGTHVEGSGCSAHGIFSHAEGFYTLASGIGAHAEGGSTRAIGIESHSEGGYTSAIGNYAHAEGRETSAVVEGSHAEGLRTITNTTYQHVEGRYNAPATGALHVIGNGSATTARSNIVETYTDRVVVNGDLINDTKDATMTKFMFDNYNYPTTSTNYGKLLTSGCKVSPSSVNNVQQYSLGNYTMNVVSGMSGAAAPGVTNPSGVIVDWDGNVGAVLQGNNWKPVSWPTDKLPRNTDGTTSDISFREFSKFNNALTELPSGWYNSFTAYCSEPGCYLYHCRGMFYYCSNLTGDVKPWMDFVLTQSGAGQAGATNRTYYRAGMFGNCTGVANYSTLTADPTYSAFFVAI